MLTDPDSRLRDVLGDDPGTNGAGTGASADAWADGFGIVAPDVMRYLEVLRGMPDAVQLAMQSFAQRELVELVDPDTLSLLSLHVRALRPTRMLEVGTGLGEVTLHLARAAGVECTLTSIDPDPLRHEQAHAFLERDELHECAVELRLGDPMRLLRRMADTKARWDLVVLKDPTLDRLDVLDLVIPQLARDAMLVVPWALRGGRVADATHAWSGTDPVVEEQRLLNRRIATDPRLADVALLPVGDGVLLARRR